jgi:hypothetical protein
MIIARFTATCPACALTIAEGSPIEQDLDTRQWVHLGCLPELHDTPRETRTVCPDCHTVRTVTGACMCEEDA